MRVLVTWGSKRGGTAGIGRIVSDTLGSRGFEVTAFLASWMTGALMSMMPGDPAH